MLNFPDSSGLSDWGQHQQSSSLKSLFIFLQIREKLPPPNNEKGGSPIKKTKRYNRTVHVDFQDESTYYRSLIIPVVNA